MANLDQAPSRSMPNLLGYGLAPFDIFGTRFQIEF